MKTYHCDDGNCELEIEAETPEAAAHEYVDGGVWGDGESTAWVHVRVWSEEDEDGDPLDEDTYTIEIEPSEPECADDCEHD